MHHVDPARIEPDGLPCFTGVDVRIARAGSGWRAALTKPNGAGRTFRIILSGGVVQLAVDASDTPVQLDQAIRSVRHIDAGRPGEVFLARGADLEFAIAGEFIGFRGRAGAVRFGAMFKPYQDAIALMPWYGFRQLRG
ncbi:hypothetical protein BOSEA31B_20345 [Hyphomicrobiales bacterium]|jgi:hypothetical protein|nr:hypothetical protein BOSEA31B_20345 [Hyphomicrobiales bacterium]CAH1702279.1 hypothetical protein BOSEA1005_30151 [Hyphomicrobiales bacterium]CAI0346482.1 hypothetical protein BO1005MUT1_510123 [Hyphomicrobiales bacterium]